MDEQRARSESLAQHIVGLSEEAAARVLGENGCTMRVGRRDTEQFRLTMDYTPWRVTVTIEQGLVREAAVG